jgi:hypothetical protein
MQSGPSTLGASQNAHPIRYIISAVFSHPFAITVVDEIESDDATGLYANSEL